MADKNPYRARIAKARKRVLSMTAGDLNAASRVLWSALLDGADRLAQEPDNDTYCRIARTLASVATAYAHSREIGELEQRILTLEKRPVQQNTWRAQA